MKTQLKKSLEKLIDAWLEEEAAGNHWPDGYVHPNISKHMVVAAGAVFDATFESSQYTEKELDP